MQALLQSHYLEGGYYPRGGPRAIVQKIIPTITSNGGKVLVSAPVKCVALNAGRTEAIGVEMEDGRIIRSRNVISDAGFVNTVEKLLPPGLVVHGKEADADADDAFDAGGGLRPATTGINLFVGLKGDAATLNLPKSNTWIVRIMCL